MPPQTWVICSAFPGIASGLPFRQSTAAWHASGCCSRLSKSFHELALGLHLQRDKVAISSASLYKAQQVKAGSLGCRAMRSMWLLLPHNLIKFPSSQRLASSSGHPRVASKHAIFNRNVLAVQYQSHSFSTFYSQKINRNKEGILMAAVEMEFGHLFTLLQASCD